GRGRRAPGRSGGEGRATSRGGLRTARRSAPGGGPAPATRAARVGPDDSRTPAAVGLCCAGLPPTPPALLSWRRQGAVQRGRATGQGEIAGGGRAVATFATYDVRCCACGGG